MVFKSQAVFFHFHDKDDTEKKITSEGLGFSASTLKVILMV